MSPGPIRQEGMMAKTKEDEQGQRMPKMFEEMQHLMSCIARLEEEGVWIERERESGRGRRGFYSLRARRRPCVRARSRGAAAGSDHDVAWRSESEGGT